MRVTADRVAARCELAHPPGVEEAGRPDPAGDDEEVGAQAAALERAGDLKRARAAVVERQRDLGRWSSSPGRTPAASSASRWRSNCSGLSL